MEQQRNGPCRVLVSKAQTSATVSVTGELDVATAPAVAQQLHAVLCDRELRDVLVDLAGVPFADVFTVRMLRELIALGASRDTVVRVAHPCPSMVRILCASGWTLPTWPSDVTVSPN